MSAAAELLRELKEAGAVVTARGTRLRIDAPVGVLDPDLRNRLGRVKPEIMRLLQQPLYPCISCGKFCFASPTTCFWCRSHDA